MQSRLYHAALIGATAALALLFAPQAPAQSPFDDAVAHWTFDESGDTIVDSKGVANMTIADATSPVRVTGLVGGALQVNAGDQKYATTGIDIDALDFNRETLDSFSVAGWVKQYDGSPVFIKMENSGNYRGWHLETTDAGTVNFLLRSTNLASDMIYIEGTRRIPIMGSWVHLAATFSYDVLDPMLGAKIYVNGRLYETAPTYAGLADDGFALLDTTNDKPFQFTARETREYLTYKTSFDEAGVWNRVLSPSEIQQLVNAGVPDAPVTNYITNGTFENTTGWVEPGTGVLPPAGWDSYLGINNPAAQVTDAAAIDGVSALMVAARLSGTNQRGMAQSFVHATDSQWRFDMDFATEVPSTANQRTVAMTLRAENGGQIAIAVSDPDANGLGDLMVGDGDVYVTIAGLENRIAFASDLSDLTGSVHHLRIDGHFDAATPNYDVILTDPNGTAYTATGLTAYSADMGTLVTGTGLMQVGFYTFKSYGDWTIDNVSLTDPSCIVVQIPGDATGDGQVNAADAQALAANWGTATGATWAMGDFNGDHKVNAADASILAANWGTGTTESAPVPEPAALTLLAVSLSFHRRRR